MNASSSPPVPHADVPATARRTVSGQRGAIALACWLLSSLGLLTSLMVAASAIAELLRTPLAHALRSPSVYAGLAVFHAWTALALMTSGWLQDRRVHWHWPVLGTLSGLICLVFFSFASFLVSPCVLLGFYLLHFHGSAAPADPARDPKT